MKRDELLVCIEENFKLVNKKLDDLTGSVASLDKQQALQAQEIAFIKKEDAEQNKLLAEHIEGTKQVREQNNLVKESMLAALQSTKEELEKRIKKLESPINWLKQTGTVILGAGALAYAIHQIEKFWPQ